jgi:hypothetical protein
VYMVVFRRREARVVGMGLVVSCGVAEVVVCIEVCASIGVSSLASCFCSVLLVLLADSISESSWASDLFSVALSLLAEACRLSSLDRSINWLCEIGLPVVGCASVGSSGRCSVAYSSGAVSSALATARTIPGVIVSSTIFGCRGV